MRRCGRPGPDAAGRLQSGPGRAGAVRQRRTILREGSIGASQSGHAGLHRQEAHVLAALEPLIISRQLPIPRLYGTVDRPPWIALVLQDVAGRQPQLPWRTAELRQVVAALDQLADALIPAPAPVPAVGERLGAEFTGWRTLATSPGRDHLDPWSRAHLDQLADLEATWADHAAGDTLLHADIRADNILLTGHGAMVVDWPWACRGAAFTDLVSVRAQRRHPRWPAGRRADRIVTVWWRGRPARRDGAGLRPGRLSHRKLVAATTPGPANDPRLPGRARHHRSPLADSAPLALTGRPHACTSRYVKSSL